MSTLANTDAQQAGPAPDDVRREAARARAPSATPPGCRAASAATSSSSGPSTRARSASAPWRSPTTSPTITREEIEAGPRNIWRYKALLPVPDRHRAEPQHGARLHPAAQGRQPRPRARHRQPVGQGRLDQPHQLLQGPRRGLCAERRHRVRQQGLRLSLDRQPRQRRRRGRRPRRHQDRGLHPEQPREAQAGQLRDLHRLAGRRERQLRRRQQARPGDRRRGGRLGVRQRQRPPLLRRGLQDPGLRDRRAARLAPARPDRHPGRLRLAADQGAQGLPGADQARPRRGQALPDLRRPGDRLLAGLGGLQGRRRRDPPGQARHHRQEPGHRQPRRRHLRARHLPRDRRRRRGHHRRRGPRRRSCCSPAPRGSSPRPPAAPPSAC